MAPRIRQHQRVARKRSTGSVTTRRRAFDEGKKPAPFPPGPAPEVKLSTRRRRTATLGVYAASFVIGGLLTSVFGLVRGVLIVVLLCVLGFLYIDHRWPPE